MGYTGKRLPGDLVHQLGQDIKVGIPAAATFGDLTVLSGATLPAFDALVVKPSGTSQLGLVTQGGWQGSGIAPAYGGTGQTSYNPGDLLFVNSGGNLTVLPSGSNGQVLTISGGTIAWV